MLTKKSRQDKDDFYMSFIVNNQEVREHIPAQYNKYEYWFRDKYFYALIKLHRYFPNFYYWHIRHLLVPEFRKTQDLLFMAHVYEEHEGQPTNKREKWFYNHSWSLYGTEFRKLVVPKLQLEAEGDVATHEYALAYYKRWLRKPRPNMKRLYHGVDLFEMHEEILDDIFAINDTEIKKLQNKMNYQKRKLKKSKKAE